VRYSEGLEIRQRIGDEEGAGLSLGGLAQLAAMRGDLAGALDLYRDSLAAFEAIGDRAEEARILSETAWTHLRNGDSELARRAFLDSIQAYSEVASVRGVGLSLIGLAATEAVENRPSIWSGLLERRRRSRTTPDHLTRSCRLKRRSRGAQIRSSVPGLRRIVRTNTPSLSVSRACPTGFHSFLWSTSRR
jgi:hypothetical protein